jgi:hypothetical protein
MRKHERYRVHTRKPAGNILQRNTEAAEHVSEHSGDANHQPLPADAPTGLEIAKARNQSDESGPPPDYREDCRTVGAREGGGPAAIFPAYKKGARGSAHLGWYP